MSPPPVWPSSLLIVSDDPRSPPAVAIRDGLVVARPDPADERFDAGHGAVLPGLHDHHVHLLAMAARRRSVVLGSPAVTSPDRFDAVLREADRQLAPAEWLRGVDHEDETGGPLDRWRLDALAPGRPVRVQHRSGALWTLSTAALAAIGALDASADRPDGIELDDEARPTGRLWRLDGWLRDRLPDAPLTDLGDLGDVGRAFASRGVVGVTDATATADATMYQRLAVAVRSGELPLDVTVSGGLALAEVRPPSPLGWGPLKVVIADHQPPELDSIVAAIDAAHEAGRTVAIHCVSRTAAALALAAWNAAGSRPGDRMEHGSVLDRGAVGELSRLGVTVVTQPSFVHVRGDHYLAEVDPADVDDLYRCRSLLAAGVPVAGSSDAPHGDADPWRSIAAAATRRTASGRELAVSEAVDAARALDLYLGSAADPGGPPRRLSPGARADICVLDRPLAAALEDPAATEVVLTVRGGVVTHRAG